MVGGIAKRIHSASFSSARVITGLRIGVAVFMIRTVFVPFAIGSLNRNAVSFRVQAISEFDGAHAVAAFVDD